MADLTGYLFDRDGAFIYKSPAASLQYALDFTNYLNTGDTIVDDSSASSPVVTIGTIAGDSSPLICLLYTSPSPRDGLLSRMPSSA